MSEKTKIAWCDSTVNFWEGCTKVSVGCANCYAEARDKRFTGGKLWGVGAPRRKSKSAVKDALAYNRKPWICDDCGHATDAGEWRGSPGDECPKCMKKRGHTRRIFSLSLGDWLDNEVPIEWLAEMLDTIRQCDQVTWMLCSKRWENFEKRIYESRLMAFKNKNEALEEWLHKWAERLDPPKNIIGLCSVENQDAANKRIPQFLTVAMACRGLSLEPLLGAVDLTPFEPFCSRGGSDMDGIDWLIIGGESGSNARPCNVDWIRSIVQQGQAAGVATFVKQFGFRPITDEESPDGWPVGTRLISRSGKTALVNLHDKKGGDPAEWPSDLHIQQWPKGF